jgi:hypothetical protein
MADVTDRTGALKALGRCQETLSRVQSVLCDSGYVGEPFEQGVKVIVGEHVTVQITGEIGSDARVGQNSWLTGLMRIRVLHHAIASMATPVSSLSTR